MSKLKKSLLPVVAGVITICLILGMLSGCAPAATTDSQQESPPSLGEIFDPSGNPLAHRFSDEKDIRTATFVVAASNSVHRYDVDYRCSGANDHVQIQAALDRLPATGGYIFFLDGTYTLGAQVLRAIDDVKFVGCGQSTLLNLDGVNPVITAGAQDGWLFADFATDAGGVSIAGATQSAIRNVWIAGVRTDDPVPPSGGDAVITVAADDTPAVQKARADFVCSGANDEVTIQALIAAGVTVKLMVGTFVFGDTLDILVSNFRLEGSGAGTIITGALTNVSYIKIGNNAVAVDCAELANFKIDGALGTGTSSGVEVQGVSDNITRLLITHLNIENTAQHGIYMYTDIEEARISFNHIKDHADSGIYYRNSNHCTFVGNIIYAGAYGIYVMGANHNAFIGNATRGAMTQAGMFLRGEANTVTGNSFGDSGKYGLWLQTSDWSTITANEIKSSEEHGMYVQVSDNNTINDNILLDNGLKTHNTYDAINLDDSRYNTVSGNQIASGSVNKLRYGIYEGASCWNNQYIGNKIFDCETGNAILLAATKNSTARANPEVSVLWERKIHTMKNTSGGALVDGNCVIYKSVAAGDEVDTTVNLGDDKVFGMLSTNGAGIANTAYGYIQVEGFTDLLKVDGTADIAIGDFLCTFTAAGIACKAGAADMAFAIALEVYTNDDSNGVIDALLIVPRKI